MRWQNCNRKTTRHPHFGGGAGGAKTNLKRFNGRGSGNSSLGRIRRVCSYFLEHLSNLQPVGICRRWRLQVVSKYCTTYYPSQGMYPPWCWPTFVAQTGLSSKLQPAETLREKLCSGLKLRGGHALADTLWLAAKEGSLLWEKRL